MGVYISNMEMPTNCDNCWALDDYGDYPRCRITEEQRGYNFPIREKRMDKCPLVEIPPHGRLIDADAAAKQGWTISRTYSASPTEMVYEAKTMTDEVLPTIIEADVHDNNVGNIPAEEGET